VETRLRKLTERALDGLILAEAALVRLGLSEAIVEVLDSSWMLPAVGQGALGLECRASDRETRSLLEPLNDAATRQAVLAERSLLRALQGGCQVPVGAATSVEDGILTLCAVVLPPDGGSRIEGTVSGPIASAEELGLQLAQELLGRGASRLLGKSSGV
jgi:hydroxymethylbilane synthase